MVVSNIVFKINTIWQTNSMDDSEFQHFMSVLFLLYVVIHTHTHLHTHARARKCRGRISEQKILVAVQAGGRSMEQ
jgi:hypothetical protein